MKIKSFAALRFDEKVVGDVGNCIAPPYDVIDSDMQQRLYDKSDYNIVRIIKPKTKSTDVADENQYTQAAGFLNDWLKKGVLKADSKPAIYAYVQDFTIGFDDFRRSGFVALARLEEFGKNICPHEKTMDGPKADRLRLTEATAAQFGQIFMLYNDSEKIADAIIAKAADDDALLRFTDDNRVRHSLFAIDNQAEIEQIVEMMATKQAIIADGHHRYETALNYCRQVQNPAAQYRMMTFVNMQNEGLLILPTHRLVSNLSDFDIDKLISALEATFEIFEYQFTTSSDKSQAQQKMFNRIGKEFEKDKNAFGIYAGDGAFYTAVLKDEAAMDSVQTKMSRDAKKLDANILHSLILEGILGIGRKHLAAQSNIEYIKAIGDAVDRSISKIDQRESQVVFFMNQPKIEQVMAVAAAGEKMPQKSTFFYPKIFTGLAINKL